MLELLEHEKLDAIIGLFPGTLPGGIREGKQAACSRRSLAIDFALDLTGELITNPDLFVASETQTVSDGEQGTADRRWNRTLRQS